MSEPTKDELAMTILDLTAERDRMQTALEEMQVDLPELKSELAKLTKDIVDVFAEKRRIIDEARDLKAERDTLGIQSHQLRTALEAEIQKTPCAEETGEDMDGCAGGGYHGCHGCEARAKAALDLTPTQAQKIVNTMQAVCGAAEDHDNLCHNDYNDGQLGAAVRAYNAAKKGE